MKPFLATSIGILVVFGAVYAAFTRLVTPLVQATQESRQTVASISAQAQAVSEAKMALEFFTPERRQKLHDALPNPFTVASRLSEMAARVGASAAFTPSSNTLQAATAGQPQELNGTLKVDAPSNQAMTKFITELETGPMFVKIKRLVIGGPSATFEIGVYVQ